MEFSFSNQSLRSEQDNAGGQIEQEVGTPPPTYWDVVKNNSMDKGPAKEDLDREFRTLEVEEGAAQNKDNNNLGHCVMT